MSASRLGTASLCRDKRWIDAISVGHRHRRRLAASCPNAPTSTLSHDGSATACRLTSFGGPNGIANDVPPYPLRVCPTSLPTPRQPCNVSDHEAVPTAVLTESLTVQEHANPAAIAPRAGPRTTYRPTSLPHKPYHSASDLQQVSLHEAVPTAVLTESSTVLEHADITVL